MCVSMCVRTFVYQVEWVRGWTWTWPTLFITQQTRTAISIQTTVLTDVRIWIFLKVRWPRAIYTSKKNPKRALQPRRRRPAMEGAATAPPPIARSSDEFSVLVLASDLGVDARSLLRPSDSAEPGEVWHDCPSHLPEHDDFSDLDALQAFRLEGSDKSGGRIFRIVGKFFPGPSPLPLLLFASLLVHHWILVKMTCLFIVFAVIVSFILGGKSRLVIVCHSS